MDQMDMSLFDRILTQPILNLLAVIYNFVGDFGVAIIILTIIVRFLLYPLVKKQLRQTKLMRAIQPELKRIKKQANGNRMVESTLMMELYRERGVRPFSSLLVLIIQIPVMIAVFRVVQIFTNSAYAGHAQITDFVYPFLQNFGHIPELISSGAASFFGVNLTLNAGQYAPALLITLIAAGAQFFQSKQIMPQPKDGKRLRDLFKDAAKGKEVDQQEMMMATNSKMIYMMPVMTIIIGLALPGAVMLYYATTSLVAIGQQAWLLRGDDEEMLKIADEKSPKASKKSAKSPRETNAVEAEIVTRKSSTQKAKINANHSSSSGGTTVVRRIKAK
jgi:YidC/Oxa1 family membrane protein insertase